MITWKVSVVKTDELEIAMNWYEQNGYNINKYEPLMDHFDGPMWVVVGYIGLPNTLKEDPYQNVSV
jgi:hypothetical protein